jgi:hypothetical protein
MTAREFLIEQRGILPETLSDFKVRENAEGWLVFPYPEGREKWRFHDSDGRKFKFVGGSISGLFGMDRLEGRKIVFLVEGETDTLRLSQELADDSPAVVVGLPGVNVWKDEYADLFKDADHVFVILDNDQDYNVKAVVEKCWLQIHTALRGKVHRVVLPNDVKDLCEFFEEYPIDVLEELTRRAMSTPLWHYEALDLTKPPADPDWLVDGLLCKGDLGLCIGEPGVGKSWTSMALAVAIAEGSGTFLGRKVSKSPSRVLYVDEENPEPLVPLRLRKLGLTDRGVARFRYLHRQGIRLDKNPGPLLEEALDFNPELIVIDSLTRVHTKDENNAGEMAKLFNDGIVPLARSTGATCLVIHHVNKTESNSSFVRSRGSSDLSGVIDTGWISAVVIVPTYSCSTTSHGWTAEGTTIRYGLVDTPEGNVDLSVITAGRVVF